LRDTGDYDVLTADREELIRLGARVVYFGLAEGEECLRWNLLLPLSAVNLERVAWHLFHELECEWDRKFIGSKPVGVDDLAEGRIKPLPLPLSGTLPRTLG
jgi:hypothetical protein